MPKYAAVIPIYMSFDSEILDDVTKLALTRIVARGIARDRVSSDIVLRDHPQVWTSNGAASLVPPEVLTMQLAAQASGEAMLCPRTGDLDLIHEWSCHMTEEDPVAYGKIPRMNLSDLWITAKAWHVAREDAAVEAELLAIRTAPIRLIECRTVHLYGDGWRWVHVSGEAALRAEGDAMGHCVGNGVYSHLAGQQAILSLRDPDGMPHVTAQMKGDRLLMAEGRSNSAPVKYQDRIDDLTGHCGAYLQMHETPGWADDEMAATVMAGKAIRDAKRAAARESIVALLDDPVNLSAIRRAVDAGVELMVISEYVIVEPRRILADYVQLQGRRGVTMEDVALIPGAQFQLPPDFTIEVVGGVAAVVPEGMTERMARYVRQAAEREVFEVRPWRAASVRIGPVPADPEAMIRTPSSHCEYAGQGTRGSIRPGMSADAVVKRSTWVSGWRRTVDRIIYGSDGADCLAYAMAAAHPCDDPFFNPNLSIAYDPRALSSDDSAPSADGDLTP